MPTVQNTDTANTSEAAHPTWRYLHLEELVPTTKPQWWETQELTLDERPSAAAVQISLRADLKPHEAVAALERAMSLFRANEHIRNLEELVDHEWPQEPTS